MSATRRLVVALPLALALGASADAKVYLGTELRGKPRKTVVVRVGAVTRSGKVVHETRRYRTCRPGR